MFFARFVTYGTRGAADLQRRTARGACSRSVKGGADERNRRHQEMTRETDFAAEVARVAVANAALALI